MKRRDLGSGGVVIFMHKDIGPSKLLKVGKCEDLVWVEIEGRDQIFFVAAAYMVPARSNWHWNNPVLRSELEEDILIYKRLGVVIVMGDFNSRIGDSVPVTPVQNRWVRQSNDKEPNANGRELVALMKTCEMTITT